MPRSQLPLALLAAAVLAAIATLAACSGGFGDADGTTGGTVEVDDRFASICGIEVTAWGRGGEPETGARECFFEHHERGEHAQIYLVDQPDPLMRGQILTTSSGDLTVREVLTSEESGLEHQTGWVCRDLKATDDDRVFETVDCGPPTPTGQVRSASPGVVLCGAEVGRYYPQHLNEAARRCLQEAFDDGTPARFFSTHIGVDGGPISSVYTVTAIGELDVSIGSRDSLGKVGLFTEVCTTLIAVDAPELWRTEDCERRSSAGRAE